MSAPAPLNLRGMLRSVTNQWRFVAGTAFAAGPLTLAVTFVIPKWYTATAVILPPEESDLLSNMSMAQGALSKFPAFGILQDYVTPADVFKAVLNSRTVQEELVRKHDLQRVYRQKSMEKTFKALSLNTRIKLNPDGTLKVSVDDKDPRNPFSVPVFHYGTDRAFAVEALRDPVHLPLPFSRMRTFGTRLNSPVLKRIR